MPIDPPHASAFQALPRLRLTTVALFAALASCGGLVGETASDASAPDASDDSPAGPGSVADAGDPSNDASLPMPDGSSEPADAAPSDASISDSSLVDASVDAAPFALPSTSPCLTGGNVLWVDGDPGNHIFEGTQTVSTGSTWAVSSEYTAPFYTGALLEVHLPNTGESDPWWFIAFDTSYFAANTQTGVVYAFSAAGADTSATAMIQYGPDCQPQVGSFRIDQLVAEGDADVSETLDAFTVAFVVSCQGYPGALRGCAHYGP